MDRARRPVGISILVAWEGILSALEIFLGYVFVVGATTPLYIQQNPDAPLVLGLGAIFVLWGFAGLVLSAGLLDGKSWAWIWTMISGVANIGVVITLLVVDGGSLELGTLGGFFTTPVWVYYLTRAKVRLYYGKGKPVEPGVR